MIHAKDFTFQYVSINTVVPPPLPKPLFYFTFQYVSINTKCGCMDRRILQSLHSSMFLLILSWVRIPEGPLKTLHSSMFLLIPVAHTCLYFNTLQCHFCLPKQLSTYSFTTSLRTTVSALIFRTVDLYYFLHYYKSTVTT